MLPAQAPEQKDRQATPELQRAARAKELVDALYYAHADAALIDSLLRKEEVRGGKEAAALLQASIQEVQKQPPAIATLDAAALKDAAEIARSQAARVKEAITGMEAMQAKAGAQAETFAPRLAVLRSMEAASQKALETLTTAQEALEESKPLAEVIPFPKQPEVAQEKAAALERITTWLNQDEPKTEPAPEAIPAAPQASAAGKKLSSSPSTERRFMRAAVIDSRPVRPEIASARKREQFLEQDTITRFQKIEFTLEAYPDMKQTLGDKLKERMGLLASERDIRREVEQTTEFDMAAREEMRMRGLQPDSPVDTALVHALSEAAEARAMEAAMLRVLHDDDAAPERRRAAYAYLERRGAEIQQQLLQQDMLLAAEEQLAPEQAASVRAELEPEKQAEKRGYLAALAEAPGTVKQALQGLARLGAWGLRAGAVAGALFGAKAAVQEPSPAPVARVEALTEEAQVSWKAPEPPKARVEAVTEEATVSWKKPVAAAEAPRMSTPVETAIDAVMVEKGMLKSDEAKAWMKTRAQMLLEKLHQSLPEENMADLAMEAARQAAYEYQQNKQVG